MLSQRVRVRAPVFLVLLDEALLDQLVKVRVEPTVVDLLVVLGVETLLDREASRSGIGGRLGRPPPPSTRSRTVRRSGTR